MSMTHYKYEYDSFPDHLEIPLRFKIYDGRLLLEASTQQLWPSSLEKIKKKESSIKQNKMKWIYLKELFCETIQICKYCYRSFGTLSF